MLHYLFLGHHFVFLVIIIWFRAKQTEPRQKQSKFFTCLLKFLSVEHNRNLQYSGDELKMLEVFSSWEMTLLWLFQRWQFFHTYMRCVCVSVCVRLCVETDEDMFPFITSKNLLLLLILARISSCHSAYHCSRGAVL